MKSNQISDESTALIGNMKLNVEKISKFNFAVREDDSELQENKRRLKFKTSFWLFYILLFHPSAFKEGKTGPDHIQTTWGL